MICPNCHKKIKDNEKICKECKKKLKKHDDLKTFIGKNYASILSLKISIPTLLFGPFYLLYRKVYSEAITLILIYLTTSVYINSNIDILLKIGLNVLLAFTFKQIYLNNAEKKISQIKNDNSEKSEEEVTRLIKKSGGVLHIEMVITTLFAYLAVIAIMNNKDIIKINETRDKKITNNTIENMSYTLPENTKVKENTGNYQYYIYKENNESCYIMISTNHSAKYKNATEYLVDKKESYNNYDEKLVESQKIDNIQWKVLKLDSKKEDYVIKYKNVIYEISYESKNNIRACKKAKDTIMNSTKWN